MSVQTLKCVRARIMADMLVIPESGRLRQENLEFQARPGTVERLLKGGFCHRLWQIPIINTPDRWASGACWLSISLQGGFFFSFFLIFELLLILKLAEENGQKGCWARCDASTN